MSYFGGWRGPALVATLVAVAVAFATTARPQSAPLANPLATHSLEGLAATRQRPLFAATRRPPPLRPVARRTEAPAPAPPEPPSLVVLGIVVDSEGARAIVRTSANKTLRLGIGEEISGWKIVQIEKRQLVLSLADRSAVFSLFSRASRKPPNASAQSAVTSDRYTSMRTGRAWQRE